MPFIKVSGRQVHAVIVFLILLVPYGNAQKKGGGAAVVASGSAAGSPPSTSSNAPFEVQMLAYGALDEIMDRLAKYACTVTPQRGVNESPATSTAFARVVVLDPPALQALQAYDAFTVNATALASGFAAMQGKAGAGGGIDDFADITNAVAAAAVASTSESSFSFTVQDPTAAVVLLHHLQSQTASVCKGAYYAGVYAVNETNGVKIHSKALSSVSAQLNGLAGLRADALRDIMSAGESKNAVERKGVPCAPIPSASSPLSWLYTFGQQDPCITAFNSLDAAYTTFLNGLSAPTATTGQPALSSIAQGYRLRALFADATLQKPMLGIYLSISAAGGTQQDRKNLFTAVFTGDWIRYSGGVSVNVIVFQIANGQNAAQDNSRILWTDLVRYRTPLEQIKKPKRYRDAVRAGDNLSDIPESK